IIVPAMAPPRGRPEASVRASDQTPENPLAAHVATRLLKSDREREPVDDGAIRGHGGIEGRYVGGPRPRSSGTDRLHARPREGGGDQRPLRGPPLRTLAAGPQGSHGFVAVEALAHE